MEVSNKYPQIKRKIKLIRLTGDDLTEVEQSVRTINEIGADTLKVAAAEDLDGRMNKL